MKNITGGTLCDCEWLVTMPPMKRLQAIVLGASALAALGGCVERKITIASDPPGAMIYLNDVEVGRTPLTVPFLWYGKYDVRARFDMNMGTKDEPNVVQYSYHGMREAKAPVYQWLGIDLIAELSPFRFVDEKVWAVELKPAAQPSDQELIIRGHELEDKLNTEPDLKRPKETGNPPATRSASTQPTTKPKQ
jgi:hypothetical protein